MAVVTKEDFKAYVRVQKSGVTNMWDVRTVCDLSDLEKDQVLDIMQNYSHYSDTFGVSMSNIE